MRAVVCNAWGPASDLSIEEVPSPVPGRGDLRIAVRACGVNFADTLIIQGKYQEKPDRPFTPGLEVAGVVAEVGEGVADFEVGDRVAALCSLGGYAEEVLAPAAGAVRIPDRMTFPTAAGFAVVYGTAHVALEHRANLTGGESLLVHGAGGGVGLAAVEVGKLMGATVIATASTDHKLDIAAEHGADHVINYSQGNFRDEVKSLTQGAGADVIFDPVGGKVFEQSMRCIAWEGRLLVIGFASGEIPNVPAGLALVKNVSVVGVYWGAYRQHNPAVLKASWRQLLQWFELGRLAPVVSATYPLEAVAEAHAALIERKAVGKVVLEVGAD